MEINITHDKKYQQFTASLGNDEEAKLAYATPEPDVLNFTHTFVPESARGKGIANKLIEEGLCYAEQNGLQVVATCPVVQKFIQKNPDYHRLLKSDS